MFSHCGQVIAAEDVLASIAVHQTLCHPSILSLFSTFLTGDSYSDDEQQPQAQPGIPTTVVTLTRYMILEYCGPHGTLSDHLPRLSPPPTSPLEESRIRGVVKTLADALTYLEKENVVHRRLTPDSVYLTEDFRVVSVNP